MSDPAEAGGRRGVTRQELFWIAATAVCGTVAAEYGGLLPALGVILAAMMVGKAAAEGGSQRGDDDG